MEEGGASRRPCVKGVLATMKRNRRKNLHRLCVYRKYKVYDIADKA